MQLKAEKGMADAVPFSCFRRAAHPVKAALFRGECDEKKS